MRVSAPGRSDPGRAPAHTVAIFIIRRLIGTIFPLIAVSMIAFAIIFLIPRLAAARLPPLQYGEMVAQDQDLCGLPRLLTPG